MAFGDDVYGAPPVQPWDWVPSHRSDGTPWKALEEQAAGTDQNALMQPGLGIPVDLLEQAAATIEPPPTIGFPRVPAPEPAPDVDLYSQPPAELEHEATGGGPLPELAPEPEPDPFGPTQPGIGVPSETLDAAEASPMGPPGGPTSEIDFEEGTDFSAMSEEEKERARVQELTDLAETDPEEYAIQRGQQRLAMEKEAANAREKAAQADEQALADNAKTMREARAHADKAMAQVDADAKSLLDEKISPWGGAGAGQQVLAFIAASMAGLASGPAAGFAMMERMIDQNIDLQKANLANKKSEIGRRRDAVGELYARTGDEFRATETVRLASWESAIRSIEAQAQNFDPKGSTAFALANDVVLARQKQAEILARLGDEERKKFEADQKRQLEVIEMRRKLAKDEEDVRHSKATERTAATSAAATYLTAKTGADIAKAEAVPFSRDYYAAAYPKNAPPPHEMTRKQYAEWLANTSKGADVTRENAQGAIKQAEARLETTGPGGSPYAIGDQEGNAIRDGKGKIFEIKDNKQRDKVLAIGASAKNVRRIADIVKIMRADNGGASKLVGSPEYQELQSLASQIDFETFVGYGLGAPSAGDKALAEGVRGGKDITSFIHDPSAGFEAYATGIEEKFNSELTGLGRTGPAIRFKRLEAAQATERGVGANLDVYDSELLSSPDIEVRKRAAKTATEGVTALAKQADPDLLKILAAKNQERLAAGLLEPVDALKVHQQLRAAFKRKSQASVGDLIRMGPDKAKLRPKTKLPTGPDDDEVDALMGITHEALIGGR